MKFTFTVNVEAEFREGKFASREELAEQIVEWLEAADEGELEGDEGGLYETVSFEAEEATG